jgi:hypothetical protein
LSEASIHAASAGEDKKHHHHKHHHGHKVNATTENVNEVRNSNQSAEQAILGKMKKLEEAIAAKQKAAGEPADGKIEVNGPLPPDFAERFIQAAAPAAGLHPGQMEVLGTQALGPKGDLFEIMFRAPKDAVLALEHQAADPDSKLVHSPIRSFLLAHDFSDLPGDGAAASASLLSERKNVQEHADDKKEPCDETKAAEGIDIDTMMPYGELEPFGREDTAQELTESSVKESDEMVDQLERAEVAEEKRAVFRALTRLRGAAITSFDGVARSQTGNIDEYNKVHQWRSTHPLHHLADEEADISKWAFPDNADF